MQRYFIHTSQIIDDEIIMNKEDLHHIFHVTRAKDKEYIECVDEEGMIYLCQTYIANHGVKIVEKQDTNNELPINVNLIYGLPKNDKFEFVLQKACELGVTQIIPYISKRSIIKTDKLTFSKKYDRFNKILKEAAQQSKRNVIPVLTPLVTMKEILQYKGDVNIVAYEESAKNGDLVNLKKCISQLKKGDTFTFVIGPEGGFDQEEIDYFESIGFICCSLGKRILRSETAPLYVLSVIGYAIELR